MKRHGAARGQITWHSYIEVMAARFDQKLYEMVHRTVNIDKINKPKKNMNLPFNNILFLSHLVTSEIKASPENHSVSSISTVRSAFVTASEYRTEAAPQCETRRVVTAAAVGTSAHRALHELLGDCANRALGHRVHEVVPLLASRASSS